MDTATARTPALQVFEDALGTRHHADAAAGEPLEVLELRDEFSSEAFEAALRERVDTLAGFRSTWFTQVRAVQRINQTGSKVFVVYDRIPGARLSTVLAVAREPRTPLDPNATVCLIRQLLTAIALLHEKLPNVAHGAISAERVIITPKARLVVADHVLGAAIEQLQYERERYWKQLRIALPPSLEISLDQRADVMQIGVLMLELLLGRTIEPQEYPDRLPELVNRVFTNVAEQYAELLTPELRNWLLRMLQTDPDTAFATAADAWEDLEQVLVGSDNRASFAALEAVMASYARRILNPASDRSGFGRSADAPRPQAGSEVAAAGSEVGAAAGTEVAGTLDRATNDDGAERTSQDTVIPFPNRRSDSSSRAAAVAATDSPDDAQPVPAAVAAPLRASEIFESATSSTPDAPAREDTLVNSPPSRGYGRWIAAATVLILLGGGAFFGRHYFTAPAAAEAPGTLVVTTNPPGVQVVVDGQPRGVSPISVELAPGAHELRLEAEGGPRIIPFTVNAGSTVSQTLELPKAAPVTGELTIRTEPAGAKVTIDGVAAGTSPLTVPGLAPGVHKVLLETDLSSVTQEVTIEAGATASLVVPMTAPQGVPMSGWITIAAPAPVDVFENGRLVGNSESDRIMVTAGRHEFDILNEELGFQARRTVMVTPGKVTTIPLNWPKGSLAINAQPWADVWINGQRIGETPIGNVTLPVGSHQVVFRHPELGEQTVRATVTANQPSRVSVDMRKR